LIHNFVDLISRIIHSLPKEREIHPYPTLSSATGEGFFDFLRGSKGLSVKILPACALHADRQNWQKNLVTIHRREPRERRDDKTINP
jgi:hypothetical protein